MSYARNDFENAGLLKPGHYNFQIGAPNPAFLKKVAGHLEVAAQQLHKQDRFEEAFQYGVRQGGQSVRQEVANFLSRQYESPVEWSDIFITNGATSGLEILLKTYFDRDQILFAENPTYPLFAIKINQDKLMTGVPIPMLNDGMDLDCLERELEKLPNVELTSRRPYRAAMYLIPTHQNPSGFCYSPEKCKRIVALARQYDLLVICDDVYNVLNYQVDEKNPNKFLPSPLRLYAYDNKNDPGYKGSVVSNGSFAKIVAPGLRLGWYEAPKHVNDTLFATYLCASGGGMSAYSSYVLAEALKSGSIDDYVQSLRVAHKARMSTVIGVVEGSLSKYDVTISHPDGGYFLWLKLPEDINSARVLEISSESEKVTFVKGNLASIRGDFSNYIRLSIAYYEAEELQEASTRLCRAIKTAINEKRKL